MQISEDKIKEFKRLYYKRFGKKLTDQEALDKGIKLVRLMQLVYKPVKKKDIDKLR
jgi:hypothetical protein